MSPASSRIRRLLGRLLLLVVPFALAFGAAELVLRVGARSASDGEKPLAVDTRWLKVEKSVELGWIFPADTTGTYKSSGRNTYSYFTDSMSQDISRQLAIEEQMHSALERGEFSVFYQKKIDIQNGSTMGAEALLRWKNPVLGDIAPDEFIPIAEKRA